MLDDLPKPVRVLRARSRSVTEPESIDLSPWSVGSLQSSPAVIDQQRFVAGHTFFNYDAFGSLRPNDVPIQLVSRQYVGLAVHVLLNGFSFYFFTYGFGRLLAAYLKAHDDTQAKAANYVLIWPSALGVVIGLVSDLLAVLNYRRKAVMVFGWCLSLLMYVVLVVMDTFSVSGDVLYQSVPHTPASQDEMRPFAWANIVISLVAATGIQVSWVAGIAVSVEFAQREHIHYRGRLQATLMVLFLAGGFVARSFTAFAIDEGATFGARVISKVSMGDTALILAAISLLALAFVLFFFREDPVVHTPGVGMSLKDRLQSFWKFCHHNVVYRVLFFTAVHLLLIGQFNCNVRDAVQMWSGVTRDGALTVDAARHVTNVLGVVIWTLYLQNVGWRSLVWWGSLLYIAAYIVLTVVTTYGVIRNEWFYTIMIMISELPRGSIQLFTFILATEIADVGHEGVTVGLMISYQSLATVVNLTLASMYPDLMGFKVSDDDIKKDSTKTRANVLSAFAIVTIMNVLCFGVIQLIPDQKLDAQQLRAFGGYNQHASIVLVITFVLLLGFSLVSNLIVML